MPAPDLLSIIVPTLNEGAGLRQTFASLRVAPETGLICVDGGSVDDTVAVARDGGARVLLAPRGRGQQQKIGAAEARGNVLWFVHADTIAPPDAAAQIRQALGDRRVVGGNFRLRFTGTSWGAGS